MGSSTVTSTEPILPNSERFLGPLTSSFPPAQVTFVSAAAWTSSLSPGSLGATSTTVSVRLPAMIRTRPISISTVAERGSGVSKVGMAVPSSGSVECVLG